MEEGENKSVSLTCELTRLTAVDGETNPLMIAEHWESNGVFETFVCRRWPSSNDPIDFSSISA